MAICHVQFSWQARGGLISDFSQLPSGAAKHWGRCRCRAPTPHRARLADATREPNDTNTECYLRQRLSLRAARRSFSKFDSRFCNQTQFFYYFGGRGYSAEQPLKGHQGGVVVGLFCSSTAVLDEHTTEPSICGVPSSGVNAHVGGDS